jgi:hypothetical protein
MIGNGGYATIVAQYHSAEDVALGNGLASSQYAQKLAQLDAAVGTLLSETARIPDSKWLDRGGLEPRPERQRPRRRLPQVPQSAAFIAVNQDENNGQRGATRRCRRPSRGCTNMPASRTCPDHAGLSGQDAGRPGLRDGRRPADRRAAARADRPDC